MSEITKWSEKVIAPMLEPKMNDLVRLIGKDNLTREMSFAIQAVSANSYLGQSTPASVAKAVWNCGITGLSLNPIKKLAYLTPRKVKGVIEATLTPSYAGLVKLLTDTGSVINAYCHPVNKGDDFEVKLGTEYTIVHNPKYASKEITHVYAVGILPDGSKQFEVMNIDEVHAIRERSDGYRSWKSGQAQSCIWETDYSEMCRKTVLKRLTKYLPKTEKWDKLSEAIEIDNQEYTSTAGQDSYIESLLNTCSLNDEQKEDIQRQVNGGLLSSDAERIIIKLQANQLNPITHGLNASSAQINEAVQQKLLDDKS